MIAELKRLVCSHLEEAGLPIPETADERKERLRIEAIEAESRALREELTR